MSKLSALSAILLVLCLAGSARAQSTADRSYVRIAIQYLAAEDLKGYLSLFPDDSAVTRMYINAGRLFDAGDSITLSHATLNLAIAKLIQGEAASDFIKVISRAGAKGIHPSRLRYLKDTVFSDLPIPPEEDLVIAGSREVRGAVLVEDGSTGRHYSAKWRSRIAGGQLFTFGLRRFQPVDAQGAFLKEDEDASAVMDTMTMQPTTTDTTVMTMAVDASNAVPTLTTFSGMRGKDRVLVQLSEFPKSLGVAPELLIEVKGIPVALESFTPASGNTYHAIEVPYTGSWTLTRKGAAFDGLWISANGKTQIPVHLTQTSK